MDDSQSKRWEAAEEGMELLHAGEIDQAVAELLRVAREDSHNEYAFHFLGHAYFQKEAYPEALKSYIEALRLAPEYVGAMIGAGQALRMMGEYDRAIRMGQRVLQKDQDDSDALFLVGAAHFQKGENQAAKRYLERYLETGPELEVALEVEGMLQVVRGETLPFPTAEDTVDN
ncbi:MAG: tetratricopeptide repeat protein [Myxococcales bacterium]|nr:tetratricopeptide repeat protein [Myxococcales bacterium]MDH3485807.1 tetratricopeptide repeat protein [Myxococcales bacterium]